MFIRRGFFKLGFEVEILEHSKEVNMVDAKKDDFDGDNDANQGERKNEGGHDMEMDNKDNDLKETSNANEQDGSNIHDGVVGMQEQLGNCDVIQIGKLQIQLTSPGNFENAKDLNEKEPFSLHYLMLIMLH
jgi:hypothetical protein